jgi:O-antigen ligase
MTQRAFKATNVSASALVPLALIALAALVAAGATVLGYRTHPAVPLAAVGVIGLAALPPVVVLHLAVALIPLELVSTNFGGAAVSPTEAAVVLASFGWVARRVVAGQPLFIPSPLNAPLAMLLLATAAGLAVGEETGVAVKRLVIGTALFFVVQVLASEGSPRTVRSLLLVLVGSGAVVAVVAVIGAAGGRPELVGFGGLAKSRATASFGEPNLLASFLGFALPAALALAFAMRVIFRPALLGAFGLILIGIVLSLSRGGFLAATGGMLVMLGWRPVRRAALVVAVAILSFGAFSAAPLPGSQYVQLVTTRIESVRYTGAATGDFRRELWATTPAIIGDNLVLGIGPGNYPNVSQRYGLIDPNQGDAVEHAHSVYLTVAAETGLLGIVALLLLAVRVPGLLIGACRGNTGWDRGLAFAVAGGLTAFSVQGLVDHPLWSNTIAALVAIFLGLALVLRRSAAESGG